MKALLHQLDAVSRKLVAGALERRGHTTIVCGTLEEATAAIARKQIDVVFVDVQMDGFALVRAVRAQDRGAGRHLPIIALAVGDTYDTRQRCVDAGADEFLSISVREPELLAILNRIKTSSNGRVESASPTASVETPALPPVSPASCLDVHAALERVEGDRELLDELLRIFVDECNNSVREIRETWNARDAHVLTRLAHTLKGSAANMGANRVSEAAFALERQVRSGNLRHAVKQIADLEHEVKRLIPELDSYLREGARRT